MALLTRRTRTILETIQLPLQWMAATALGITLVTSSVCTLVPSEREKLSPVAGAMSAIFCGTALPSFILKRFIEDDEAEERIEALSNRCRTVRDLIEEERRARELEWAQAQATPIPDPEASGDVEDVFPFLYENGGEENVSSQPETPATMRVQTLTAIPNWHESGRPEACKGCRDYVGRLFQGQPEEQRFICALYPYGQNLSECWDWRPYQSHYKLTRLQGLGTEIYFVRTASRISIAEQFEEAVEIEDPETIRLLMRKYGVKSVNGLPGKTYSSDHKDIEKAFDELLEQCPDE